METCIPFQGFYESMHAMHLDDILGLNEDSLQEENISYDDKSKNIDFKKEMNTYAKQYCKAFSELIGIGLTFKDMSSPREYNFTTDRIFAEIEPQAVQFLIDSVDDDAMRKLVKEKFTSRSGFHSFYSNDYDTWLEDKFDHNQIETLLECYVAQEEGEEWEVSLLDDISF